MPLVLDISAEPVAHPRRRAFSVAALCIALALAASATAHPEKGLVWASAPSTDASAKIDAGLDRASTSPTSVIVQARRGMAALAAAAVQDAGGRVGTPLPVIDGFEATAPGTALLEVAQSESVRAITANRSGQFSQRKSSDELASSFPSSTGATAAWDQNHRGEGVGVAVIDTGVSPVNDLSPRVVYGPDLSGEGSLIDTYGHGTVMAGLIAGNGADSNAATDGAHVGMAPNAHVISVKTAGANGVADVSTILQAMHWVSAYRTEFDIRVLNLAWGTASTQDPALDPLNYAVERLWNEGIVVVVAAGNSGPGPSTVTKPGDDPMVITVGAYDDRGDDSPANDRVPEWSSQGPTAAGVSKPDLVAPGRTLVSTRSFGSRVEAENPSALVGSSYIKGSGTSQAAAVTSGAAALVLAAQPGYTPDQVKAVLKGSAVPLPGARPNQSGAGRLQVSAALTAPAGPASWQASPATGLGSLEASRGGRHISTVCDGVTTVISGEMDASCQPWDAAAWTGGSWTGGSWTGGSWTGGSWTGGSWTGGSWTGGSWTGGSWTGGSWTGGSWTGGSWTGGSWTGGSWTGGSWTGGSWTGGSWTTAFWGNQPKSGSQLPGEVSEPTP